MPRLQSRRFSTPDEVRLFTHGRGAVLKLGDSVVGRAVYEPGWRWTADMPEIAGTPTCQLHHLGYAISGFMHVVSDDGQELDIEAESVYEIPAGHDAWVVGDEPWVTVEWTSARTFGVAPEGPGERVLATVLFTDIVDSTSTLERIGDAAWRDLLVAHNRLVRDELNAFRGRRSPRPAMGSWQSSMGRPELFAAVPPWRDRPRASDSRSASGSIPAKSSSSAPTHEALPSTRRPASCRSRALERCSSRRRRRTCLTAPAWSSRTPAPTF